MSIPIKYKQPADVEDFDVDYSNYLPEGDSITTVELSIDILGELVLPAYQIQSPIVKVWTSGGMDGGSYKVTVTASTAQGRVKQQEFNVRVKEI